MARKRRHGRPTLAEAAENRAFEAQQAIGSLAVDESLEAFQGLVKDSKDEGILPSVRNGNRKEIIKTAHAYLESLEEELKESEPKPPVATSSQDDEYAVLSTEYVAEDHDEVQH